MVMNDFLVSNLFGARLTRRQFIKAGGFLAVGCSVGFASSAQSKTGAVKSRSLDPTIATSWIEILEDNSILFRTGKPDFGQGTPYTAYRQIVAEELRVGYEDVKTAFEGHTDITPDGGGAFYFLWGGAPNIRKVAAYTYQALLDLAEKHFGVPKSEIVVRNGLAFNGTDNISYGALVKGYGFTLEIPVSGDLNSKIGLIVTGEPPYKPVKDYNVIGKTYPNPIVAEKVAATALWNADVSLSNMLHARVVCPKTLGSSVKKVGKLDKALFPGSKIIVLANRIAIVAENEWEAIKAAQDVAAKTTWTEWKGLPTNQSLYNHLRSMDWNTTPVSQRETGDSEQVERNDPKVKEFKATYTTPYYKHAPIGPAVAVGDVKASGEVIVYASSQNPQALRKQIAEMLETDIRLVVVKAYPGPGQFGRSNGGNGGAEDDAVMLSKIEGRPVRVQWMRPEDTQWSPQCAPSISDIQIHLGGDGSISEIFADYYMPALNDDRPIGAVLAGFPTMESPGANPLLQPYTSTVNTIHGDWKYDRIRHVVERGHGSFQIGEKNSPNMIGLRTKSMRTPGQFQQNFAIECAINETALLANIDPIDFRMNHTKDVRLIEVLKKVRDLSSWENKRLSNTSNNTGERTLVRGHGVATVIRQGGYWACICEISVSLKTGKISVDKYYLVVDPGIVINPQQLQRQAEGGAMMGISQALFEEVSFDESGVTDRDWYSYPILTMADIPEIHIELIHRPEVGVYGGGSEAANSLAAPAIAAAFQNASNIPIRKLPLKSEYVLDLLKSSEEKDETQKEILN